MSATAPQEVCSTCGRITAGHESVSYGSIEKGYRLLCYRCFNIETAQLDGLDKFEHLDFEPIRLVDCSGQSHDFHFKTRLFGPGIAMDAYELRKGHPAGYEFQIIGDPEEDLMALLGRLVEKIRRALSVKHLTDSKHGTHLADHRIVRGRIEWDADQDGHVPLVVIDGRELTWDELGHMLMSCEGWQFKLEIRDPSDEL